MKFKFYLIFLMVFILFSCSSPTNTTTPKNESYKADNPRYSPTYGPTKMPEATNLPSTTNIIPTIISPSPTPPLYYSSPQITASPTQTTPTVLPSSNAMEENYPQSEDDYIYDWKEQTISLDIDLSDNSSSEINIITPQSNQKLIKGQNYEIKWEKINFNGAVRVHLYKNDAFFCTLAAEANDNTIPFNPPDSCPDGDDYKIGIASVEYPSISTLSNNFSISSTNNPLPDISLNITYTPLNNSSYKAQLGHNFCNSWTSEEIKNIYHLPLIEKDYLFNIQYGQANNEWAVIKDKQQGETKINGKILDDSYLVRNSSGGGNFSIHVALDGSITPGSGKPLYLETPIVGIPKFENRNGKNFIIVPVTSKYKFKVYRGSEGTANLVSVTPANYKEIDPDMNGEYGDEIVPNVRYCYIFQAFDEEGYVSKPTGIICYP